MVRVLKPSLVTTVDRPSLSPVFQMKTNSQTQSPNWRSGEVLMEGPGMPPQAHIPSGHFKGPCSHLLG